METASKTLGILGEELAFHFVKRRGYKVLLKNYRCPLGEIDLIAKEKGALIFMEVKTRSSLGMGAPAEAVDFNKRQQLTKCAQFYLERYSLFEVPCRFDVVSILIENGKKPKFELIQNAFSQGE